VKLHLIITQNVNLLVSFPKICDCSYIGVYNNSIKYVYLINLEKRDRDDDEQTVS